MRAGESVDIVVTIGTSFYFRHMFHPTLLINRYVSDFYVRRELLQSYQRPRFRISRLLTSSSFRFLKCEVIMDFGLGSEIKLSIMIQYVTFLLSCSLLAYFTTLRATGYLSCSVDGFVGRLLLNLKGSERKWSWL